MYILELRNVRKAYSKQVAVDNVSFSVRSGTIFGLLGPNGAGKTSTIRMITGITRPDSGDIHIFGEPLEAGHQNKIGYMPEERGLYRKLSVREQLEYLGALKGLSPSVLKERINYWLKRFEIENWSKKKTNELSKGMQQKLQFIATILHDPELLILDEPLSGLDPINAEIINDVIQEIRKEGRTILLSTHRMEQVEQLCDDIVLVNLGRVVLSGSVREVKRASGRELISLAFTGSDAFVDELDNYQLQVLERHPYELLLQPKANFNVQRSLAFIAQHAEVRRWEFIEPPLKELFLEAVTNQGIKREPVMEGSLA